MKAVKIIFGVLTVLIGVFALYKPFGTFLSVSWILGTIFLVDGVGMLTAGLSKKKKDVANIILGILLTIGASSYL